eukprot:TRINITY_DN3135_c0_g1_i1.p1 TRINITY_DN3135_c0_g1~~TRINITY_DN3135_c0_g1_i1.p1  ORF type:complete len:350 (-),score=43.95 TRINITY_DN3135_c0_g1_i1:17-1066(-)
MKLILLFSLISLILLTVSSNDIPIICNQTGAHTDAQVTLLADKLNSIPFTARKMETLAIFLSNTIHGFTGSQTVTLLKPFRHSSDMHEALSMLNLYILGITSEEACDIVMTFSFSSDKLDALRNIVNMIVDLENNSTIIDGFPFSSDKAKAAEIIAGATGRSCIYGTITEKRVQFLVDVSFSMRAEFIASNGQRFNRLTFVQRELKEVIRKQLKPDQSFNVFSFSGIVVPWQPGLVQVNTSNLDMAVNFVDKMNFRADGTNSYEALRVAFSDPDVEAIYFLTDGQPSVGPVTNPDKIVEFVVKTWNTKNIPVHCTAFLAGYYNGDNKFAAKQFMENLAMSTGGIYRSIE